QQHAQRIPLSGCVHQRPQNQHALRKTPSGPLGHLVQGASTRRPWSTLLQSDTEDVGLAPQHPFGVSWGAAGVEQVGGITAGWWQFEWVLVILRGQRGLVVDTGQGGVAFTSVLDEHHVPKPW